MYIDTGSTFFITIGRSLYYIFKINMKNHVKKIGGGPRVVVSTAAFHARVWGLVLGRDGLKDTKNVFSPSTCKSQYSKPP